LDGTFVGANGMRGLKLARTRYIRWMNISSIDWDPSDVASSSRKTSTVRIRGWRPSTQTPSVMMGGTICLLP